MQTTYRFSLKWDDVIYGNRPVNLHSNTIARVIVYFYSQHTFIDVWRNCVTTRPNNDSVLRNLIL